MTSLTCNRIETCRQEIVPDNEGAKAWRRGAVLSVADIGRVIEAIADAMTGAGYSEKEIYRVHLSWKKPSSTPTNTGTKGIGRNPSRFATT
jgi:hypothetical protein